MITNLLEYLNHYYSPTYHDFSLSSVKEHMREKFGVTMKVEDNLVLFKYDQLEAKWSFPITKECRGHIYRVTDVWERVCNPFDKFFNLDEGHCPVFPKAEFQSRINEMTFSEKVDGSLIPVWYDLVKEEWRASTSGMITPGNVGDCDFNFETLFWKTLGITKDVFSANVDTDYTYIFELACPENRIVAKYKEPTIVLLGVRHKKHGTYYSEYEKENVVLNLMSVGANVRLAWSSQFYALGITDQESCKAWVEQEGKRLIEESGIEYSEGFVVYSGSYPIAKIKNTMYVNLHHVGGGDMKHSRNVVISAFFTDTLDDLMGVLIDTLKDFAKELELKVDALFTKIKKAEPNFRGQVFENQKDYAMAVQKWAPKEFWGFFFTHKDKILDPNESLHSLFKTWIKANYARFDDYWKSKHI